MLSIERKQAVLQRVQETALLEKQAAGFGTLLADTVKADLSGQLSKALMGKLFKKSWSAETFGAGGVGRKALGLGAGAAIIGGGVSGTNKAIDHFSDKHKKKKYFKQMIAENPQLKKETPKDVTKVFNTLFRFNKKMASDPLVAGSFLKRSLQFKDEGIQPVDVKTLTEVGKHLSDTKKGRGSILGDAFGINAAGLAGLAG